MDTRIQQILNNSKIEWTQDWFKFYLKSGWLGGLDETGGIHVYDFMTGNHYIYVGDSDFSNFVALHELAHATGFYLGRRTVTEDHHLEECLANRVAMYMCTLLGIEIPWEIEHLRNYPGIAANPKEVRRAIDFIQNNWCQNIEFKRRAA